MNGQARVLLERSRVPIIESGAVVWSALCVGPAGRQRHVPYGADQTAYLVVDRFGGLGSVYRETEVERTDLETIITDLLSGQFNDPIRVVAFNTLEHWSRDVSEDIALEIQTRCDIQGAGVSEHIQDFVANYTGLARQLAFRLV